MAQQYRVYITPKVDVYMYGEEIEVSDYVLFDGLGKIRQQIDAEDYNVGVFNYDDLTMKCKNKDGKFNEESDIRSIFKFTRDQAKVRVVFNHISDDGTETLSEDTMVYNGLINEEATKLNAETEDITFRVLSRDSVIRNTEVAAGIITDGMTVSAAIMAIMEQSAIAAVLNTDEDDVNPDLDFSIDVGSELDSKSCREVLNKLLRDSNSVMIIDDDNNVTIRDRSEDETRDIINLYGPYDIYRRQNTVRLVEYNTGKHRMYNSFKYNTEVQTNSGYQIQYGFRQFEDIEETYITEADTAAQIAANLLDEFKFPKLECMVEVPLSVVPNVRLLDRVSMNWPLLLKPWPDCFFPIIGITEIGSTIEKLPIRLGTIDIPANIAWKVIQIEEDPKKFTKTLKLRQAGKSIEDGYFTIPGSSLVGFAIVGDSSIGTTVIGGEGTVSYNPSIVGAAVVGNTLTA